MSKHGKGACKRHRQRSPRTRGYFRPVLEALEDRLLLSAGPWPVWLDVAPAQAAQATLDASQALTFTTNPGSGAPAQAAGAAGVIVNQGGAGGVNWYSFTLDQPSDVALAALADPEGGVAGVLSLYNTEPQDFFYPLSVTSPPFNPQGHRLLAQAVATGGEPASLERRLAAGTYFVAVSGDGDTAFNPFLAGSGYAGDVGSYRVLVTATPLPLAPADGPVVLAVDPGLSTDPADVRVLHESPLAIHVELSGPLDPSTTSVLQAGGDPGDPALTVHLTFNPTGDFGNGLDAEIAFTGAYFAAATNELELQLAAPLGPGFYRLTLAGDPGVDFRPVLTDANGVNLGLDQDHPLGQDFTIVFQIDGIEGVVGKTDAGDDTADTAHDLGDLTSGTLVHFAQAIGDDPAYDPALPWPDPSDPPPYLFNPAADVDLYHFRVSGDGQYQFAVEVFAERLGSTLNAAVSLFRVDDSDPSHPLRLIASNDNSNNDTLSSDGNSRPLTSDPILDVGLMAGDYYLAVSSSGNLPDFGFNTPGSSGVFDPNVSHSGSNGSSTGAYVLNLMLQPAPPAPQVVSTSLAEGATLTEPPTVLTVEFDSHVNVSALAQQAFEVTTDRTTAAVFFVGPDGQRYYPRLDSFDESTNQAVFLLLDRLPNGASELHLSGAGGLTGHGGTALVGNDTSGDYVVRFSVEDPTAPAAPQTRSPEETAAGPDGTHDLGTLFPRELQEGVVITGTLAVSADGDPLDVHTYTIRVLQEQEYHFNLTGPAEFPGGPPTAAGDVQMTLTDAAGVAFQPLTSDLNFLGATLLPGTYTIQISRPSQDGSAPAPYQVRVALQYLPENPPPLSVGSAPVLQIRQSVTPPQTPGGAGQTPGQGTSQDQGQQSQPSNKEQAQGQVKGQDVVTLRDALTPALSLPTQMVPIALNPEPASTVAVTSDSGTPRTLSLASTPLLLRADLVGGVKEEGASSQVASSLPQAQGVAVPAAAFNFSVSGTLLVAGLSVPQDDASNRRDQNWLGFWSRRFDTLEESQQSGPYSDPGSPGVNSQRPDVAQASSDPERGATPEGTKAQPPVGPISVQVSEGTPTGDPADEANDPPTAEQAARGGTWVGAAVGGALAAFLVWRKVFAAGELSLTRGRQKAAASERANDPTRRVQL